MKRLLIVSPHFPPTDITDLHRVRMNARYYARMGWRPFVLSVRPDDTGHPVDQRLVMTLPDDLSITEVSAPKRHPIWTLGVSAIGIRAYKSLALAGDRLLESGKFDLVFFSTTAFPVMRLGVRWRRRFNVPYVLDFQDPWYVMPCTGHAFKRTGLRHAAMRAMNRMLELQTVPKAAGLISVNQAYINTLKSAYPEVSDMPTAIVPFASAPDDLIISRRIGRAWVQIAESRSRGRTVVLSAGRLGGALLPIARRMFEFFRSASDARSPLLGCVDLCFLGTGYQAFGNPFEALPLAHSVGVERGVFELPNRIPLIDSLASLDDADFLLIIGSADTSYQPSKLHQYVDLEKPVLVFADEDSELARACIEIDNVVLIATNRQFSREFILDMDARVNNLLSSLRQATKNSRKPMALQSREAACMEASLFDRAYNYAASGYGVNIEASSD